MNRQQRKAVAVGCYTCGMQTKRSMIREDVALQFIEDWKSSHRLMTGHIDAQMWHTMIDEPRDIVKEKPQKPERPIPDHLPANHPLKRGKKPKKNDAG